ncbi:isochorismatase family protein [Kineosporia sp. NBRC 101731]|uniref:isochorismatase family protein n=1 Tax=Kineosporia sp. NBRC 101731 TaxID=3032199 RepID=UPI0024A28439|nr:isochorismatase family protein [Kineosporia sp. NBRC 101731]GLY29650.1 N-carbamoylsarcosine amidase [Kineosporia sp. NBRC 101731]
MHGLHHHLSDDFAAAGLAGQLTPGRRAAFLLIDPARAYTDPASPLYAGVEAAAEVMRTLLGAARRAATPVVVTRVLHEFPTDGGLFARKVPATGRCFTPGNPWADYIEGLEPVSGECVVTKQYPSAFFGTALAATLTATGVDTLVIAGLSTSGCVRASALDALQHGFAPFVVADAVGDRDHDVHTSNLRDIDAKIGQVIDATTALTLIESAGATTDI